MIDSHIHLTHHKFQNKVPYLRIDGDNGIVIKFGTQKDLIADLKNAGISTVVEPGIDLNSNEKILRLARKEPGFVLPAVGVHPTRTYEYPVVRKTKKGKKKTELQRLYWDDRKRIREWSKEPAVVAIGETGLDYHQKREAQHRLHQFAWFLWQLELAHRRRLPVILHVRRADRDALRILRLYRHRLRGGVCHCFSGSAALAKSYTDLGLMLGIGGKLLSRKNSVLEQAVRETPLEYILLETDGPFLSPYSPNPTETQQCSARNTSLILPAVIARIAEIKHVSYETVERITDENARRLFRF